VILLELEAALVTADGLIQVLRVAAQVPLALVDGAPETEGLGVMAGRGIERFEIPTGLQQTNLGRGLLALVRRESEHLSNVGLGWHHLMQRQKHPLSHNEVAPGDGCLGLVGHRLEARFLTCRGRADGPLPYKPSRRPASLPPWSPW